MLAKSYPWKVSVECRRRGEAVDGLLSKEGRGRPVRQEASRQDHLKDAASEVFVSRRPLRLKPARRCTAWRLLSPAKGLRRHLGRCVACPRLKSPQEGSWTRQA